MVFTNAGKNKVRDLIDEALSHATLGTDSTTPTFNDTDLVAAVSSTSAVVTTTTTDKQIVVDYNLPSTTAQGSTFSEFGIYTDDGVLLARFVFSSLTHSSLDQWQLSTRLFTD